jgi:hypothetical protein
MKIYDISKTYEITNPDLEKGYIENSTRVIAYHPATPFIKEVGHYETVKQYSNGGADVKWVVDVEGSEQKDAYEETEQICVYIPYSDKELAIKQINKLKQELSKTDYKAIKFAEGAISENEYYSTKIQRQSWRDEINELVSKYGIYE